MGRIRPLSSNTNERPDQGFKSDPIRGFEETISRKVHYHFKEQRKHSAAKAFRYVKDCDFGDREG